MPNTLLRLAVALLTFGLGVAATTLWIASGTPEVRSPETETAKKRECNARRVRRHMPLPPTLVEMPPPPPHITSQHGPGAFLEDKVLSKPAPVYPSRAVASNASGLVEVWVALDKNGKVVSANAISGHPLLQEAAVDAAYKARFSASPLDGQPGKVSGIISYEFVLP